MFTLTSGLFLTYHPGEGIFQYGLPLVWKTQLESPGGGTSLGALRGPSSITTYSWVAFILDVLLYVGAYYSLTVWGSRFPRWLRHVSIPVSGAWLSVLALTFSWSSNYDTLTNGLPLPWMGLYDGWSYNWGWLTIDILVIAGIEYLAIFLYQGLKIVLPLDPRTQIFSRRVGPEKDP